MVAETPGESFVMEFQPPAISEDEEMETNFTEEPVKGEREEVSRDGGGAGGGGKKGSELEERGGRDCEGVSRGRRGGEELAEERAEEEDGTREGKKKKKRKKRQSKDHSSSSKEKERDTTRHKPKKKRSHLPQHNLSSKSQPDLTAADYYYTRDYRPAEYQLDGGMDRVPVQTTTRDSASSSRAVDTQVEHGSFSSRRSHSHEFLLDSRESGHVKRLYGRNYGHVSASDEFTPPWLDEEEEEEGAGFVAGGKGQNEEVPVYTEEVAALIW